MLTIINSSFTPSPLERKQLVINSSRRDLVLVKVTHVPMFCTSTRGPTSILPARSQTLPKCPLPESRVTSISSLITVYISSRHVLRQNNPGRSSNSKQQVLVFSQFRQLIHIAHPKILRPQWRQAARFSLINHLRLPQAPAVPPSASNHIGH